MVTATVLVPTHNHGRLLAFAVASALAQTVSSIEVFIVGDGVDDATRAAALGLVESDSRVRFFDRPKGQRHGEALRHAALQNATGTIVCYLSDDDLWLPHHVETLQSALWDADFAHAVPIFIDASGNVQVHPGHLDASSVRARMCGRFNFIPLSAAAHTLEFYRRLPTGWAPAPQGLPTDLHMWQQILSVDGCRAVSTTRATLLNFPALLRQEWTMEQRADELSRWSDRLPNATLEADLVTAALNRVMRTHVDVEDSARRAAEQVESLGAALAHSETTIADAGRRERDWHQARAEMQQQIDDATDAAGRAESLRAALAEEREAERSTLLDQNATLRSDLAAAAGRADSVRQEREAERCSLLAEIAGLRHDLGVAATHAAATQAEREAERSSLLRRIAGLQQDLVAAIDRATAAQRVVQAMERTVTWRLRRGLLDWKPIAAAWAILRRSRRGSGR